MAQESRLAITIDSRSAEQKAKDLEQALSAMEAAGIRVVGSSRRVSSGMAGVGGAARTATPSVEGLNKELANTDRQAAASAATINRVLKAALAGFSAMHVIDAADNWGQYASRMRMATETADEYNHAQQRMAQSAQLTFRAINETREAFIQLSPVLREMGLSLDQSIDAVDAFSGLLVVNGANAERGAAAMEALAKSFQRGRVDAQAWMTIYSTADTIVEHLAKSSGKTAAEIRQMGVEGKISAEMMAKALVSAYEPVIKQVEGMPTTVRDALTNLSTAFGEYIGWQNEAYGATAALASSVSFLGENLSTVLSAGMVAAGGALAGYTLKGAAAVKGMLAAHTASVNLAKANLAEATTTARKSAADVIAAQIKLNAVKGTAQETAALSTLRLAKLADVQATQAQTAAQASLNRAQSLSNGAMKGVLGLLGGPAGLAVTAGLAATAWLAFSKSTDEAKESLIDIGEPLDETVRRFQALDAASRQLVINEQLKKQAEAADEATDAWKRLQSSTTRGVNEFGSAWSHGQWREFRRELESLHEAGESLEPALRKAAEAGVVDKSKIDRWYELASILAKANDRAEKHGTVADRLAKKHEEIRTAAQGSASGLNSLNDALGIEKWDEYLKKLTDARDVIGMNAKQLGAFEAAQAGANSLQQEMAGIVTAQTDAFKKLQSAIDDKDKKAIEAAQNNIRALDIERQKVELLAIKTQALIAATNAFARGEVSGDVASGIVQNMLQGFSQAEAAIAVSKEAEAQIKNIYANTNPSDSTKGGANAAKESARLLQTLRDQVAVLGMSESEMQRYQLRVAGATPEQLKMADSLLATKEAFEKTKAAQEAYKSLMLDLRTEEERTNDQFKERIKVLREANLSTEQYQASLNKLVTSSVSVAPKFDGVDANVGGASGELIRVAQARAELDQWRAEEIQKHQEYLSTKQINEQAYADAVLSISQQHNEQQRNLSDAWRSATLANFASVTGDAAEMLKGLGMEGSAIYKAMFIASKAASIAQAIVNTELAYTRALATPGGEVLAPWIRGLGYASVGVMAATSLTGMAHSGIDQIPREGTWLLDKGERVLSPRQNSDLTSYLKKANTVPAGAGGGGQPIQINVEVNIASDGSAQTQVDGAGAQQGRQLAEMVAGMVQQGLVREMRQGGLLWNQQNGYSR